MYNIHHSHNPLNISASWTSGGIVEAWLLCCPSTLAVTCANPLERCTHGVSQGVALVG